MTDLYSSVHCVSLRENSVKIIPEGFSYPIGTKKYLNIVQDPLDIGLLSLIPRYRYIYLYFVYTN